GKAIATGLRERMAQAAAKLREEHGIIPGLAAVLVGDDPASQIYVRSKARACAAARLASFEHRLTADAGLAAILDLVTQLNGDDRVDGILVQLPLPSDIDPRAVIAAIDPDKDVDGFHPVTVGRPQMVKADWLKPEVTVIDVGINRIVIPEGGVRLVGDVDFAAARRVAGAITPVPGGVGPMTIACLLRNTLLAACRRRGLPDPASLSADVIKV